MISGLGSIATQSQPATLEPGMRDYRDCLAGTLIDCLGLEGSFHPSQIEGRTKILNLLFWVEPKTNG